MENNATSKEVDPDRPCRLISFARIIVVAAVAELACWLVLFWLLILRARLKTGDWPHARGGTPWTSLYPANVDPHIFAIHHVALGFGLLIGYYLIPFALLVIVLSVFVTRLRVSKLLVASLIALILCAYFIMACDPLGSWSWFMD